MMLSLKPVVLSLSAFAMATSGTAAHAQFGKLFKDARRGAETAASKACGEGKKGNVARGALGGLLGGIGGRTARRAGVTQFVPQSEFVNTISTEIACLLAPEEQKQAADATLEATRGGGEDGSEGPPIGQSAQWESETRDDVQGTSTVTARTEAGGYDDCITVTDVIIIEGEETRAEKRMCRLAGKGRYSIVA
ncbi:MAG: hypothetical protein AAF291_13240 [Pseudomonadota bacterium]